MTEKFIPLTIYQIMRAASTYHTTIPNDTTVTIFKWILSALFTLRILLYISYAFLSRKRFVVSKCTPERFFMKTVSPLFILFSSSTYENSPKLFFPVSIKSKVICSTNCIRNLKFSIYFNSHSTLSRWLLLRSWSVKKETVKAYPRPPPCFRTATWTNVLLTVLPETNSAMLTNDALPNAISFRYLFFVIFTISGYIFLLRLTAPWIV